jgi:hypothetical protein
MTNRDSKATRRLLRLKAAAEYLSISPGALRGLCQRGEIPVIRLNDGLHVPWLLDARDLDSWVERSKAIL